MPMHINIFSEAVKTEKFQLKFFIFSYFALDIHCVHSLEPPRRLEQRFKKKRLKLCKVKTL